VVIPPKAGGFSKPIGIGYSQPRSIMGTRNPTPGALVYSGVSALDNFNLINSLTSPKESRSLIGGTMSQRNSIWTEVLSKLESIGFKARAVSFEHLAELKDEIERAHSQGLLADGVYRDYNYAFSFEVPEVLPPARSIIIVASPAPALEVTFTLDGRLFQAIIPPVYNHDTDQQVFDCIADVLRPKGHQLANAAVPKKLLATRSGLAKYGKNNITYVDGMGSYHRLAAFYTDAAVSEDHWQEPEMLDQCQSCVACVKQCPTDAISSDRFLLRAEMCITYHNESEKPFPKWIDPSWHNCLIGCMICQNVCPGNPPSVRCTVDAATFSEEETNLILKGVSGESLAAETAEKLKRAGIFPDCKLLARNLKVLLDVPN
jgi:epoxyqueuosine reductase